MAEEDQILVSRVTIWKFLQNYNRTHSLARKEGSGLASKITDDVKLLVERQMEINDETTAYQLHKLLVENGYDLSLSTIVRCRKKLGWTFRG